MGISVVGLVRVLRRIVRVHVIWHRPAIDHEVGRVIRLGWNIQAAVDRLAGSRDRAGGPGCHLGKSLAVNARIHLSELEEVFAVVAGLVVVVCRGSQAIVGLAPVIFSQNIGSVHP